MAKKEKKGTAAKEAASPADAVRSAVEQAFAATAGGAAQTRGRAQEIVDDITSAASRVREALGPLDDLRGLRAEVDSLARRVAALEVQLGRSATESRATPGTATAGAATETAEDAGPGRS